MIRLLLSSAASSTQRTWVAAEQLLLRPFAPSPSAWAQPQQQLFSSAAAAAAAQPATSVSDQPTPSYEKVLQECMATEAALRQISQQDGAKRLQLSTNVLPRTIPQHDIEEGLTTMDAYVRPDYGRTISKWLRKVHRVPARITFPHGSGILIHLAEKDVNKLVRDHGLHGCQASVLRVQLLDPGQPDKELAAIRVKPQQVRCSASSGQVQNLDTLFCPQDLLVYTNVPIKLSNADASVGVRKGAWLHMVRRTVKYQCRGSHIPPFVEVDVKGLDVGQGVRVRDLPIPEGSRLAVQNFDQVVVQCTSEGGDEIRV